MTRAVQTLGCALVAAVLMAGAAHAQQNCQPVGALMKLKRAPAAPPSGEQADAFAGIELRQLEILDAIGGQLANVVRRRAALYVCADNTVNAFAAVVRGAPIVGIDLSLLQLLRHDRDAVAFVLSHEYAHLLLGHAARQRPDANELAEAGSAGAEYEKQSGRRGIGVIAALRYYDAKRAAYSRAQETAADDTGYQLMLEAGFNPAGALNAARTMLVTNGASPFNYFATHPGWEERVGRIQQIVKFEVERRELADKALKLKATQTTYVAAAQELLAQKKWAALLAHVKAWQGAIPDSGAAWYYAGMYERERRRQLVAAKNAFERALALDPAQDEALYMLCVTLHDLNLRTESAYCGRDLKGGERYEAFVGEQFRNRLWTTNPASPLPEKVWLAKEPDGSTLITNVDSVIERRGLQRQNVPLERQQLPWHAP